MPSRFEPAVTGQMIALAVRHATIVRATGGLRDTVIDVTDHRAQDGLPIRRRDARALSEACESSWPCSKAGGNAWEALLDRGMAVDFDWRRQSAPAYLAAYERAVALRRRSGVDLVREQSLAAERQEDGEDGRSGWRPHR